MRKLTSMLFSRIIIGIISSVILVCVNHYYIKPASPLLIQKINQMSAQADNKTQDTILKTCPQETTSNGFFQTQVKHMISFLEEKTTLLDYCNDTNTQENSS